MGSLTNHQAHAHSFRLLADPQHEARTRCLCLLASLLPRDVCLPRRLLFPQGVRRPARQRKGLASSFPIRSLSKYVYYVKLINKIHLRDIFKTRLSMPNAAGELIEFSVRR